MSMSDLRTAGTYIYVHLTVQISGADESVCVQHRVTFRYWVWVDAMLFIIFLTEMSFAELESNRKSGFLKKKNYYYLPRHCN